MEVSPTLMSSYLSLNIFRLFDVPKSIAPAWKTRFYKKHACKKQEAEVGQNRESFKEHRHAQLNIIT